MLLFFFTRRKRLQTFVLIFSFFLQEEKANADIRTNVIVFLQLETETVDMCTNVIVFLQEETVETVDKCINVIVFLQEEKETRHQYTFYCFSPGGE